MKTLNSLESAEDSIRDAINSLRDAAHSMPALQTVIEGYSVPMLQAVIGLSVEQVGSVADLRERFWAELKK